MEIHDLYAADLQSTVTLVAGWRRGNTVEVGQLEITRQIAERFRAICQDHLDSIQEKLAREYRPDIDLEPSSEHLYLHMSNLDQNNPVILAHRRARLADPITPKSLPSRSLLFYSIMFSTGPIFLRKMNSYQSLNRGRMFTRLQETLAEIEDPVFSFDDKIDLVIEGDLISISNLTAFEHLFRSETVLTAHVAGYIRSLDEQVPLTEQSCQVLEEECKRRVRLRRRLEAINHPDHLPHLSVAGVLELAPSRELDPSDFVRAGRLDIDLSNVDDVLMLLNDDLFWGGFSRVMFTAEKKSRR